MSKLIKRRTGNFTHIKNDIFDSELSAKAIGLFCYLWHLPDDWHFYVQEIATHFTDGKDSIQSGLKELQKAGFLKRVQSKDDTTGKFKRFDWELNEAPNIKNSPQPDFPAPDNPAPGEPAPDNPPLQNTNITKDEYTNSSSRGDADEKTSNDKKKTSSAFTLYEKLWGFPNAIAREDLRNWIKDYSDDLVSYAINIAGHNNVSPRGAYKYLSKILENWNNLDINTVEDAKKQNQEHERRNDREYKHRKSYGGKRIKESMPDYSAKDKQKATSADKAKAAALKERIRKLRENK